MTGSILLRELPPKHEFVLVVRLSPLQQLLCRNFVGAYSFPPGRRSPPHPARLARPGDPPPRDRPAARWSAFRRVFEVPQIPKPEGVHKDGKQKPPTIPI